jgi:hypothetical protein
MFNNSEAHMSMNRFLLLFVLFFALGAFALGFAAKALGVHPETMVAECRDKGKFDGWVSYNNPPLARCGNGDIVAVKR